MTLDLDDQTGIDAQEHEALLADIQGNILKGHGREQVRLLLVRFTAGMPVARRWARAFGNGWVTPASRQAVQAARWQASQEDSIFINLFLTCPGYSYLGLHDAQVPPDPQFRAGMLGAQARLGDPPGTQWEPPYDPGAAPLHAMVLLAASTTPVLEHWAGYVERSLAPIATVRRQAGQMLRQPPAPTMPPGGAAARYVDHLNYLDGRSQPQFFRKDVADEAAQGGIDHYDPSAHLGLVLVKEPAPAGSPNGPPAGHGSYLVYRKLEQNVRGFKERERAPGNAEAPSLADQLGLVAPEDRKRVGAMVVGRFENGTPVALSAHALLPDAPNNFNYDSDAAGAKCPVFAHIRKVNPRTAESRRHRIVRRGITYDDIGRAAPPSDESQTHEQMPESGVGLLFMCFQAAIESQFEHLQRCANNPDFPAAGAGVDPLIGPSGGAGVPSCPWPSQWGGAATVQQHFGSFVRLKDGEYFFAPSKSFFKGL